MEKEEFPIIDGIKATNTCRMRKNYNPPVDDAGHVLSTPLQAMLRVKTGAEVFMVYKDGTG